MARFVLGQCLILAESDDTMFCEILGYRGSGEYYVSLTRGIVDTSSKKFPPVSILHGHVIDELRIIL